MKENRIRIDRYQVRHVSCGAGDTWSVMGVSAYDREAVLVPGMSGLGSVEELILSMAGEGMSLGKMLSDRTAAGIREVTYEVNRT